MPAGFYKRLRLLGNGGKLRPFERIDGKQRARKMERPVSRTPEPTIIRQGPVTTPIGDAGALNFERIRLQQAKNPHKIGSNRSSRTLENAPLYGPGYKTATTWKGPWIGLEVFYFWKECRFSLGYEFHFAHYKAKHTIPQNAIAQLEGFANQATSPKAYGNVVFLSGNYLLCGFIDLGLYFKYQNWQAPQGTLKKPLFAANGYRLPVDVKATGEWTSYLIGLNAGVLF